MSISVSNGASFEADSLEQAGEGGPLSISLSDGASVSLTKQPVGQPFAGEHEHELVYGQGANVFQVGSATASTEALYVGTHTVIKPAGQGQLTLDLYASLRIASDFLYEAVCSNWDTLNVQIVAQPMSFAGQTTELIGPPISYPSVPVVFTDIPCKGGFESLTLPASGVTAAPTEMRNLDDNWDHLGTPPWETGRFKSVTIGAGRMLDFYQGEGFIYTASRTIDGTVRYWPAEAEVPIIVTDETTPAWDDLIVPAVATIYGDWNGDCVISNVELAQLQAAIAGGSSTYDPLMDSNCDGVLNNVDVAKFLDNMIVQPSCGGRDGGEGEGEGDDWAAEEDGGAEEEDDAGERSGGEDGVDVAELAAWIVAELSPEELAVFVADLAVAVEEFAGTPAGADMAALLAEFE